MPTVIVKSRAGEERQIDAEPGISLMENLRAQGVDDILAICGGCCACATCHVYVDSAFADLLPPMSDDEYDLLSCSSGYSEQSRLSCQIEMSDALEGLRITIAPED